MVGWLKSGRLSDDSKGLLKACGISIKNGKNALTVGASNFPIDLFYLRNSDIPSYVEDGVADLGIVGENLLIEKRSPVRQVLQLGFSRCKLSLAVPKGVDYPGLSYFEGKRIATSYPNTLADFLQKNGINAGIHKISGSVEIAPNIGLAEGICDLVSTGSTLFSNGLKEVQTILRSEAVLVANAQLSEAKQAILDQLLFRINAVQNAKRNKYVILNAPKDKVDALIEILPGLKSPTIVQLADKDWYAMHSVISEDAFWESIDELKANGAQGILVVPIEKVIV